MSSRARYRSLTIWLSIGLAALAFALFLLNADRTSEITHTLEETEIDSVGALSALNAPGSEPKVVRVASAVEVGPSAVDSNGILPGGALRGEVLAFADLSPIGGARVSLRQSGAPTPIRTAMTNAEGRFELVGIPPHSGYEILVEARGFTAARRLGVLVNIQTLCSLDSFLLARPFSFEGRVCSSEQAAISGAEVTVLPQVFQTIWNKRAAFFEPVSTTIARGRTDATGKFALEGITPGVYEVRASAKGFATRYLARIPIAPGEPRTIELVPGHELRITPTGPTSPNPSTQSFVLLRQIAGFNSHPLSSPAPKIAAKIDDAGVVQFAGLEEGTYLLAWTPRLGQTITLMRSVAVPASKDVAIELPSFGTLEGAVLSDEGIAIGSARVFAIGEQASGPFIQETLSDEMGAYRLELPVGGAYSLWVSRYGTSGTSVDQPPAIAPETVTRLDLRVGPGKVVEGRVTDADSGRPIAGAQVRIWLSLTTTDIDGRYRLEGVRNLSSFVQVVAPGYWSPASMSPAQGMEDEAFFGPFRLEMRSEVTQKDIELRRTAALRGKILDSDGAALASARVAVVRENDSDERGAAYEFDSRLAETATNPSGAFSFRDLPSQVGLRLRVSHTRVATHVTDPLRLAASAQDEIVIRLERDGVLRGHVVDESDLPLPEVLLQVARVGQEQSVIASAKTDADGWFQLTRVPPGQLIAWARMPGRLDAMLALGTLAAGEERDGLLLRMPPIPPLRGIVVDESGTPISGVNVFARDTRAGTILEEQSTGADGTFSWPHIPAGIYGVFARPVGEFGSVIGGNVQHPRPEPFKIVLR